MAQRRVEQDDNVTIVYTKIPDAVVTSITVKPLEHKHVTARISRESDAYLRRMGYSQGFRTALLLLLNSMTNSVINTASNAEALRMQQERRAPYLDYSRPVQPIRMQMPANLQNAWEYHGLGTLDPPLQIPSLGTYFPNTTQYPDIFRAFASPEGQRFMARYYTTGWLRQDQQSGEWVIAPPVPPSQITPRRTAQPSQ